MKERKSKVEKRQVTFDWNPVYYRAKKGAQGHRGHSTRYFIFHPLWPSSWCSQAVGRAWSFFRVQRPKDMTQETGNGCVLGKSSCVEQTNRCHNEAGNKCSGVTSLGKHSTDQGPQCLARRSEKLLDALQSLGGSLQFSSLLVVQ